MPAPGPREITTGSSPYLRRGSALHERPRAIRGDNVLEDGEDCGRSRRERYWFSSKRSSGEDGPPATCSTALCAYTASRHLLCGRMAADDLPQPAQIAGVDLLQEKTIQTSKSEPIRATVYICSEGANSTPDDARYRNAR